MSNLTRWEPEREMMTLREAMDRLFDDALLVRFPSAGKVGLGLHLQLTCTRPTAKSS